MVSWSWNACRTRNQPPTTTNPATSFGACTAAKRRHEANKDSTPCSVAVARFQSLTRSRKRPQSQPCPPSRQTQGSYPVTSCFGNPTGKALTAPGRAPPRQMAPCYTFTPDTPPTASGASRSPFKRNRHHETPCKCLQSRQGAPCRWCTLQPENFIETMADSP